MPLTLLDFIVIGIMLISGLLALMRGFTREILSLVAWIAAAIATYFVLKDGRITAWAHTNLPYLENDKVAMIAAGAFVFLIVLIIISIVSVKISDFVIDSQAGVFDRTLGRSMGSSAAWPLSPSYICSTSCGWYRNPSTNRGSRMPRPCR